MVCQASSDNAGELDCLQQHTHDVLHLHFEEGTTTVAALAISPNGSAKWRWWPLNPHSWDSLSFLHPLRSNRRWTEEGDLGKLADRPWRSPEPQAIVAARKEGGTERRARGTRSSPHLERRRRRERDWWRWPWWYSTPTQPCSSSLACRRVGIPDASQADELEIVASIY
jgi:hypothetical protein